jgi:hypothetical protein
LLARTTRRIQWTRSRATDLALVLVAQPGRLERQTSRARAARPRQRPRRAPTWRRRAYKPYAAVRQRRARAARAGRWRLLECDRYPPQARGCAQGAGRGRAQAGAAHVDSGLGLPGRPRPRPSRFQAGAPTSLCEKRVPAGRALASGSATTPAPVKMNLPPMDDAPVPTPLHALPISTRDFTGSTRHDGCVRRAAGLARRRVLARRAQLGAGEDEVVYIKCRLARARGP